MIYNLILITYYINIVTIVVSICISIIKIFALPDSSLLLYLINSNPNIVSTTGITKVIMGICLHGVMILNTISIIHIIGYMYIYKCVYVPYRCKSDLYYEYYKDDYALLIRHFSDIESYENCEKEVRSTYERNNKDFKKAMYTLMIKYTKKFLIVNVITICIVYTTIDLIIHHNNRLLNRYDLDTNNIVKSSYNVNRIFENIASKYKDIESFDILYLIDENKFVIKDTYTEQSVDTEIEDKLKNANIEIDKPLNTKE